MGRKSGHLLTEVLFSFMVIMIIVHGLSLMFTKLAEVNLSGNNDLSYCLYALTEEISLANFVEVYEQELYLHNADSIETIYLHNHRIVKSPGFNIYLNNVDEISFSHDDNYVYMKIKRSEMVGTFKIGVYYRPSFRVCESNSDLDCSDVIDTESIDDSNN